jgi:hypothetical protein
LLHNTVEKSRAAEVGVAAASGVPTALPLWDTGSIGVIGHEYGFITVVAYPSIADPNPTR